MFMVRGITGHQPKAREGGKMYSGDGGETECLFLPLVSPLCLGSGKVGENCRKEGSEGAYAEKGKDNDPDKVWSILDNRRMGRDEK
jgi:hypothetical protein